MTGRLGGPSSLSVTASKNPCVGQQAPVGSMMIRNLDWQLVAVVITVRRQRSTFRIKKKEI